MSKVTKEKPQIIDESGDKYKYGFVTAIEADTAPKGLNEDIIRLISAKKRRTRMAAGMALEGV